MISMTIVGWCKAINPVYFLCRHRVQLTQCGFHTPNYKLYKDMGTVELDDAKLILDGLGQTMEV